MPKKDSGDRGDRKLDKGGWRDAFPFEEKWDKRKKHGKLKSLIIAGALIAAEIDRINKSLKKLKIFKQMTHEEQMLQSALNEIMSLRKRNELMAARLDVFDTMMRLFHTNPNFGDSGGFSPDIAYEINSYLEKQKTNSSTT